MADDDMAIPWFPGKGLTWDEWHASLLGLVGGCPGVGFVIGYEGVSLLFSFLLITLAFGVKKFPNKSNKTAVRVVRKEPWYFTTVFVASAVLTIILL